MQALALRQLTKTYKNGIKALKGIDLEVAEGDFFALLGPNGAGKTTVIGIVTSLVNKTSGIVEVFGHDMDKELEVAKSCIGVVPQEMNFNMFESLFTIVVNQAGFYGIPRSLAKQRAEKYLKQLSLWDRRNSIARSLSGGMKRRLMIARALMHEPRLLILDEPTAGVDIEIRRSMWEFLRNINEQGTTIILTTHYLEEAENLCRNVAIIEGGRIIERDSMVKVLRKLQTEIFVLNLNESLAEPPEIAGFRTTLADDRTLEVEVSKGQTLNDIFAQLTAKGIRVNSMRNKVNRLEELFIRLVDVSARAEWVGFSTIIIREFNRIVRIWGQTIVPPTVTATLYFVIFGSLIGKRVGQVGGYDYMQFIAPGLIMMTVITNSYANVVSSFFGAKFGKHLEELLVSPMPNWLILSGYIAGGMLRGLLVGSVVTVVAFFFTRLPVAHVFAILSAALLTSMVFALGGFINALFATNFDQISWFPTFVLAPLTYLGGVFYSTTMLPGWAQTVSKANPILYMVSAFRYGFLGTSDVDLRLAYGIMVGAVVAMFTLAVTLLNRGTGIRD